MQSFQMSLLLSEVIFSFSYLFVFYWMQM